MVAERLTTDHNVSCEKGRREVEALYPEDSSIVDYCRGVWRIKGIIQVIGGHLLLLLGIVFFFLDERFEKWFMRICSGGCLD